jgi:hypothetical protein
MIILTKKWENKTVYKTGHGSVNAWRVQDKAFVELPDGSVTIKYLKSLYGFKDYKSEHSAFNPKLKSEKVEKKKKQVLKSKNKPMKSDLKKD